MELDRYLVPFDPRQVPLYRFDVIVLGCGAAGSVAALTAAGTGASVAVVAKGGLRESNTNYAQGGLAAVLSDEDSFASHVVDTLDVGCGLSDRATVEAVVHGGPAAVERLLELGAEFDRGAGGALALSREGGHSHDRIIHAQGDATGIEIQRTVTLAIVRHPRISTFAETFAIDLLDDPDGRVVGVLCRTERGDLVAFCGRQVILATGGAGQIYRETTNPDIATADGVAMALRAGAVVRDLEFIQFHPTCLYIAGAARVLISEVVRGAGGVLRDRHGVRFMPKYHPQADLAPRDVVSRAVFQRMVATNDTSVYLDLSQIEGDPHLIFPGISRICRFFGIDIARDPVPVRPGAHYMIGGVEADLDGRTSAPGLWAVGECASTGLHGANRMGSNSLLEGIVLGARVGECAARELGRVDTTALDHISNETTGATPADVRLNLQDLTYSLKSMMWRQMGVERDGAGMEDALAKLQFWSRAVHDHAPQGNRSCELVNMLTVAHLATLGALAREESRGVHYRSDFPEPDSEWRAHTALRPVAGPDGIRAVELLREPLRATVATE
ncbi:MAG: L-aspartate oxidase [Planctomycetota bacterium]|nr:MAG: L-aspartate oxidase [Planctomycetota bacterium]